MPFNLKNLDETTRKLMVEEINHDIGLNNLNRSKRFNAAGDADYAKLLIAAAQTGSELTLAASLKGKFNEYEMRGANQVKVPWTAAETFAEGEFVRFYIRALCLRAITNQKNVTVYRAKHVDNPRPASEAKIGQQIEPQALLVDLRKHGGLDTHLKVPGGVNSGLCVHL